MLLWRVVVFVVVVLGVGCDDGVVGGVVSVAVVVVAVVVGVNVNVVAVVVVLILWLLLS